MLNNKFKKSVERETVKEANPPVESEKKMLEKRSDTGEIAAATREKKKFDFVSIVIFCFVIPLTCFHLYTAYFGILDRYMQVGFHWMGIAAVLVLTHPYKFKFGRIPAGLILDWILIILNIAICIHMMWLSSRLVDMPGMYTHFDIIMGVIMVPVEFLICGKVTGKMLPIMCLICIAYAFFGSHFSGYFATESFSFNRIVTTLYVSADGMFGSNIMIPARFLFLFLLFGSIMSITGSGQFFVDAANSIVGRARGGPAQAAVYSSMLMGMVTGSGPANVATCGTFTIPLMKKVGYRPADAAAVEAVASTGGIMMPPVMGQAAFLMMQITGLAYAAIAAAATLPSILYFFGLSAVLYCIARRDRLPKPDKAALPKLGQVLKARWYYSAPLLTITYFIFANYSAQRAVFYAIIAALIVCLLVERHRLSWKIMYGALRKAAINVGPMAACCLEAGIIMSMINLTGFGLKISTIITDVSGGSLLIILVLTAILSLILGIGLPISTAYIMLAILLCPAIVGMGVPVMAAHLFVMMFGAISALTPPVAMSVFVAASIAQSGMWETGGRAMVFAASGFLIPFYFCYNQALLLMGTVPEIVVAFVVSLVGIIIMSMAIAGWFIRDLHLIARLLLAICAVPIIVGGTHWPAVIAGFVGFVLVSGVNYMIRKNRIEVDIARGSTLEEDQL